MGRRTVLLLLSLVIAALGTTLVFLYIQGREDDLIESQRMVEVLVAQQPIAAGTSAADALASGAVSIEQVPRRYVPDDAISDLRAISDQVTLGPIFAGEQILSSNFGRPGAASGLRETIPEGQLALSVQLGDPERVAGYLSPGSEVAVFLTAPEGGSGQDVTRVLLPEATVLAVGSTSLASGATDGSAPQGTNEEVAKTLLTLAVDQEEAQRLVYGTQHGELYFGLLSDSSQIDPSDSGTSANNIFR